MKSLIRLISVAAVFTIVFLIPVSYAYGMNVIVKQNWDDSTISLDVESVTTIESLKQTIYDKTDIPPDRQKIFYDEQLLEDGRTIWDYGITDGSLLLLFLREIPTINIIPESINFGKILIGETKDHVLEYAFIESTPGEINLTNNNGIFILDPKYLNESSGSVKISFAPTRTGIYSDTLILTDSSGKLTGEVRLTGMGIAGDDNQSGNNNNDGTTQNDHSKSDSQSGADHKTDDSINILILTGLLLVCVVSVFFVSATKLNHE